MQDLETGLHSGFVGFSDSWDGSGSTTTLALSTFQMENIGYDYPFYLLLNVAVGGTWAGLPDGTTVFPQTMPVDYVRVFQANGTAERFEANFVDDFTGWRKVIIPFAYYIRSSAQPGGAPNDGLSLNEVWGYGFVLPEGAVQMPGRLGWKK